MCKEVACMCRVSENNRQQANYLCVMCTNEFSPILLFLSVVFHSAILSLEFILFLEYLRFLFLANSGDISSWSENIAAK